MKVTVLLFVLNDEFHSWYLSLIETTRKDTCDILHLHLYSLNSNTFNYAFPTTFLKKKSLGAFLPLLLIG